MQEVVQCLKTEIGDCQNNINYLISTRVECAPCKVLANNNTSNLQEVSQCKIPFEQLNGDEDNDINLVHNLDLEEVSRVVKYNPDSASNNGNKVNEKNTS